MDTSYSDYVTALARQNPSLKRLSDFLRHQLRTSCNSLVTYVEIGTTGDVGIAQETSTTKLIDLVNSGLNKSIIVTVENIHPDDVESLGSCLDIDPFFFCGHIAPSYADIERNPLPSLLALPPSRLVSGSFINIHYQKLLDLGDEVALSRVPYDLALMANVTRSVRRLPALSGRSIGILRACTSLIKKDLPGGVWISLILIDPTSEILVHPIRGIHDIFFGPIIPQSPRRIATETFCKPSYAEHQSASSGNRNIEPLKPSEEPLSFFHASNLRWRGGNPSILALAYNPIQAVVQEWILYALLMGRYVKYYEYSSETVQMRRESFEEYDIIELHRWRRRSLQSLHKLGIVRRFVEHWASKEKNLSLDMGVTNKATTQEESVIWNLLIGDIKYVEEQIMQHARSLEALNPIITALIQLADTKRAISQAEDTRRLTYIAIIFLPMSFLTGLFSMSEPYGPGSDRFWIYWVVALPLTAFIIVVLVLDLRFRFLSIFWAIMQKRNSLPRGKRE
ncbi:conserved hypothetical protein [Talaromyces stipitatus ATCC 10500]|uniref:CorA family metal ion transporter n=1 Tax=Talaromyces stipitatus (strain ATCC 10500 / CBS 375.48 / QM 6759 / NRRL 1006) TaxID=441959 RepID=B8LXA1_TALSN|nr:uncharacterized protein TSTA_066320 [Talaromyces stipitatus ATCC 10500]EED23182.1 conserved hypothetical protein [Talaromyces stipitatus ATCC 10500]